MRVVYYLVFVFTVWVVENILIRFPYKGQVVLYNSIVFSSIGLVLAAYAVFLYLSWREKRGKPNYPSTVRARIRGGLTRGSKSA